MTRAGRAKDVSPGRSGRAAPEVPDASARLGTNPGTPSIPRPMNRSRPAALLVALSLLVGAGCESATEDDPTVTLTVRMRLRAETKDVGPAAAAVWIFGSEDDRQPIYRAVAYPAMGISCPMTTTPVTICEREVPRGFLLSLLAEESDPAISAQLGPPAESDTARNPQYVRFATFSGCDEEPERGTCVIDRRGDIEVDVEFQYLAPFVVYQVGTARFDYLAFHPAPSLRVPAQAENILNGTGCRGIIQEPIVHCDTVHQVGGDPVRRFIAWAPPSTTFELRPGDGAQTHFVAWDTPCSEVIAGSGCMIRTSGTDTSGTATRVTFRYEYWDCPAGPRERDFGGCTLVRP